MVNGEWWRRGCAGVRETWVGGMGVGGTRVGVGGTGVGVGWAVGVEVVVGSACSPPHPAVINTTNIKLTMPFNSLLLLTGARFSGRQSGSIFGAFSGISHSSYITPHTFPGLKAAILAKYG